MLYAIDQVGYILPVIAYLPGSERAGFSAEETDLLCKVKAQTDQGFFGQRHKCFPPGQCTNNALHRKIILRATHPWDQLSISAFALDMKWQLHLSETIAKTSCHVWCCTLCCKMESSYKCIECWFGRYFIIVNNYYLKNLNIETLHSFRLYY